MIKKIFEIINKNKTPSANIFSESPLKTSFYEELQKNEWCNVVSDKPDNLMELITINIRKTKKI